MRFCFSVCGGSISGGSVDVLWHCVKEGLRDVEAFDTECFEVDLASGDAAGKNAALSALEHVHYKAGGEDDGEEDGKDDDQEDPKRRDRRRAADVHADEEADGVLRTEVLQQGFGVRCL